MADTRDIRHGSEHHSIGESFSRKGTGVCLTLVILVYVAVSVLVLRTDSPPVVDEPIFATSALEFAKSGELHISNLSAPNAVFDTVWGGLFALIFDEKYVALRFSTIFLTAISGPFVYLLCRAIGGSRSVSVLGVAAYLFAPLAFPLSITFQTDSHFLALTVMAISVIAYGLTRETHRLSFLLVGSGVSALAFLSRPQGLVVTLGAVLVLTLSSKERANRLKWIVALTALPAFTVAAHSFWTSAVGEPYIRGLYRERLLALNPKTYLAIGAQGLTDSAFFVGMFALPFIPLLFHAVRRRLDNGRRLAVYLAAALAALTVGLLSSQQGPLFEGSWVRATGLGAVDRSFLGSPPALPFWTVTVLLAALAVGAYSLILSLSERKGEPSTNHEVYHFVVVTLLGFAAGAVVSTLGAHPRILDRYWLPLLPLVIALSVSVSRCLCTRLIFSWSLVALLGFVSVTGTIDAFNTYRAATDFAEEVVSEGVHPLALEAGASWAAVTFGLNDQDPQHLYRPGPFWIKFYAVESKPEYGIVLEPLDGYQVLERREYRSILHPGPEYLYFVHRDPDLPFYFRAEDF